MTRRKRENIGEAAVEGAVKGRDREVITDITEKEAYIERRKKIKRRIEKGVGNDIQADIIIIINILLTPIENI